MSHKANDNFEETKRETLMEKVFDIPLDALSDMQEIVTVLKVNRLFQFEDSDKEELHALLASLRKTQDEIDEIVEIISEQAGLKHSDKYKE